MATPKKAELRLQWATFLSNCSVLHPSVLSYIQLRFPQFLTRCNNDPPQLSITISYQLPNNATNINLNR